MNRMRMYVRAVCSCRLWTAPRTSFSKERIKFRLVMPEKSSRNPSPGFVCFSRQHVLTTKSKDLSLDLAGQVDMKLRVALKRQAQTFPVNARDSRRGAASPSRRQRCGGLIPS